MELIKEIGPKRDRNGWLRKKAIFWCDFCKSEVEKTLNRGLKQKSCGCVRTKLSGISRRGGKRTEVQKEKISKSLLGKKQTEETKQKKSKANKGKIRTEEQKQKYSEAFKGKSKSREHRQKLSNAKKGKIGSLSNAWQEGKSFEIYPQEFNKELKQQVLERDNYICQNLDCNHKSNKLHIHHIDFDKKNNSEENLITLCHSCHAKTIGKNNRIYFIEFYQNIMENKINV